MSSRGAQLMDVLGLSEEELCRILDADALTLISGQLEHAGELRILLDLLDEARTRVGDATLRRWVRLGQTGSRPIDALLARDFARFEDALVDVAERGLVVRARQGSHDP
jgi:hypothetical protein